LETNAICQIVTKLFYKKQERVCTYEKKPDGSGNNIGYTRRKITYK